MNLIDVLTNEPVVLRYSMPLVALLSIVIAGLVGIGRWVMKLAKDVAIIKHDLERVDRSHITHTEMKGIEDRLAHGLRALLDQHMDIKTELQYLRGRLDKLTEAG